jgi:replicative DNA helicase
MTVGLQALHAIIINGSRTAFRQLNVDTFTEDELVTYTLLRDHYARYGALPSMEVLGEMNIVLPESHSGVQYHLDQLRDRAIYMTIDAGFNPLRTAVSANDIETAREIVANMHAATGRLTMGAEVTTLHEAAAQVMEEFELTRTGGRTGVTLKWPRLNAITDGIFPGDVLTIVARTGIGKSYLIAALALAAWIEGNSILFVTMEMTIVQIVRRIIAMATGLNPDFIRRGDMSHWGIDAVHDEIRNWDTGSPFHLLSGDFRKTVTDVDNLIQEFSPDAVYIDASYLIDPVGARKNASKWENLADVGEDIKRMAMMRNKPILQTVQFNRTIKENQTPDLAGIRGTDQVAIVSSIVVAAMEGEPPNEEDRRRLYVLKNRDGSRMMDPLPIHYRFTPGINFEEIIEGDAVAAEAQPIENPENEL